MRKKKRIWSTQIGFTASKLNKKLDKRKAQFDQADIWCNETLTYQKEKPPLMKRSCFFY